MKNEDEILTLHVYTKNKLNVVHSDGKVTDHMNHFFSKFKPVNLPTNFSKG